MKIITIGVFAFIVWSALSTYLYVCKIKGLCDAPVTMQISEVGTENTIAIDTIQKPVVPEQIVIPKDLIIYFAFDRSDFSSNEIIEKYFDESNAYLKKDTQANMKITGYTDAIGTEYYNLSLGLRRAQSIQHYFETKGVKGDKIIILSKGESEPTDNNDTKAGRANNRRTVITINK